jgi:uncharacterized membrane protein (DUF485 family)
MMWINKNLMSPSYHSFTRVTIVFLTTIIQFFDLLVTSGIYILHVFPYFEKRASQVLKKLTVIPTED